MTQQPPKTPAPMTDAAIEAVSPQGAERPRGRIEVVDYDPAWPAQFDVEAARIRAALGLAALAVEHVGSTAVPGLAAKPVIDIHLAVADSADEAAFAPRLEQAGYRLIIREPDWFEHRMFRGDTPSVNLHVFTAGCPELGRVRLFRDWLRTNEADRSLYGDTKRRLAQGDWAYVQNYADAKQPVISAIYERAEAWAAAGRP